MNQENYNKGLIFAICTALISGVSIFFSGFAVKHVANPFVFTAIKSMLVVLALSSFILLNKKYTLLKNLGSKNWWLLVLIGIIGGGIPFLMFFKGLSISSAIIGGFIHKTLFVWVAFLAVIFLKEQLGKIQWVALSILLLGNYLLGAFNYFTLGKGELLILGAVILWSLEYIVAKKILQKIDPDIVSWARMFFGSIIIFGYLIISNNASSLFALNGQQFLWSLAGASFLLLYVTFWYRALKYAPASLVSSVLVLGSPITSALSLIFVKSYHPNIYYSTGLFLIIVAAILFILGYNKNRISNLKIWTWTA